MQMIQKHTWWCPNQGLYGDKCGLKGPLSHSSSCTTTELSILLTSCLTGIKDHVIEYWKTVYEKNGKNLYWHWQMKLYLLPEFVVLIKS